MVMNKPMQRVILVDDEPNILEYLAQLLHEYHPDIEVVGQFQNIEEAWKIIESGKVDGVFLDINWGLSNTDATGFKLAGRFRLLEPKPWIIFVSGYSEHSLPAFNDYDAKYFIEKPIRLDQLEKALDKVRGEKPSSSLSTDVFIVHGHDNLCKTEVEQFVEKLGFKAIILHKKPSKGKTLIEKIEEYTQVGYAIVIYTPDDAGNTKALAKEGNLQPRARQNVIFEHGYLIAKLGRHKVAALLVVDDIELPSDINGIVYIGYKNWKMDIANEMEQAGYVIDRNRLR